MKGWNIIISLLTSPFFALLSKSLSTCSPVSEASLIALSKSYKSNISYFSSLNQLIKSVNHLLVFYSMTYLCLMLNIFVNALKTIMIIRKKKKNIRYSNLFQAIYKSSLYKNQALIVKTVFYFEVTHNNSYYIYILNTQ